ncbi:MAG TPA: hypothetical protein VFR88_05310 [Microlunatus sp.]|nr:hypothetical protein [Microlunatus sp.]
MNELRAYADGRWADFGGLEGCTLAEVDAQLGPRRSEQLHGGIFGGEPTQFAVYSGGTAAPNGVTAWVLGEVLVGLEIRQPSPPPGALDDLGQPPAVISSELGRAWRQELWPERGLVLHRRADLIAVAFGLQPFDPVAWESDPLRRWRSERRPSP